MAQNRRLEAEIRTLCLGDDVRFLNVIDALLHQFGSNDPSWVKDLADNLLVGNSAWTIAPDAKSLTRPVDATAAEAVAQAVAPHDAASDELAEAWRRAYGREPNPSDAWDYSIKAVEHILKPVVSPNNTTHQPLERSFEIPRPAGRTSRCL